MTVRISSCVIKYMLSHIKRCYRLAAWGPCLKVTIFLVIAFAAILARLLQQPYRCHLLQSKACAILPFCSKKQLSPLPVLPIFRIFAEIRNFCTPWKFLYLVFQLQEKKSSKKFFFRKKNFFREKKNTKKNCSV